MWQLKHEGQKQKAGVGPKASETMAKGHCFGTGSIQGRNWWKNSNEGKRNRLGEQVAHKRVYNHKNTFHQEL